MAMSARAILRAFPRRRLSAVGILLLLILGCDQPAATPTGPPGHVTVASLVPAATDLLLGMGAGDKLVAVSNYDQDRPETASLPRVGDYRTIDWEKIAETRPTVMVVQYRADKMPAGLEERAAAYGIRLVNIRIYRLDDLFTTITQLGDAIGEAGKAKASADRIRAQLDAVRARVAGRTPVRTYLGRTDNPLDAVGGGNYVDDLLTIAGGANVLSGPGYDDNSFPSIDREMLRALDPEAAINLLPAATPQSVDKARAFWGTLPELRAVRDGRVHYLTEPYLLWPGINVGTVAERLAEALHPIRAAKESHGDTEAQRTTWFSMPFSAERRVALCVSVSLWLPPRSQGRRGWLADLLSKQVLSSEAA